MKRKRKRKKNRLFYFYLILFFVYDESFTKWYLQMERMKTRHVDTMTFNAKIHNRIRYHRFRQGIFETGDNLIKRRYPIVDID